MIHCCGKYVPAVSKLVVTIVTIRANIEKVKIGVNCNQSGFVQLATVRAVLV